jgi:hypothetical protein
MAYIKEYVTCVRIGDRYIADFVAEHFVDKHPELILRRPVPNPPPTIKCFTEEYVEGEDPYEALAKKYPTEQAFRDAIIQDLENRTGVKIDVFLLNMKKYMPSDEAVPQKKWRNGASNKKDKGNVEYENNMGKEKRKKNKVPEKKKKNEKRNKGAVLPENVPDAYILAHGESMCMFPRYAPDVHVEGSTDEDDDFINAWADAWGNDDE